MPSLPRAALVAMTLFGATAQAVTINVVGIFPGKAVVAIDGAAPRSLSVGDSASGAKLVAVGADNATFIIDGHRTTIAMGGYVANANTRDAKRTTAVLTPDTRGHYMAQGSINGVSTRFLVDTGATLIALSANEAARLGVAYRDAPRGMSNTANGAAPFRLVKLDTVKVGDVELHNVDAAVIESGYDGPALLGMSFLTRTEVSRDGQNMVLTRRY